MKVHTTVIGNNTFAIIEHDTGTLSGLIVDPKKPASSLREAAADLRGEASRKIRQASLLEEAAIHLESPL